MVDFEDFWAAYPRKQDKKKAQAKWSRLSNKVKQTIMDDIAVRYQGIERQFIPMPTTYMNGERWEDEIIEVQNETHQRDTRSRAKRVHDKLSEIAAESIRREQSST